MSEASKTLMTPRRSWDWLSELRISDEEVDWPIGSRKLKKMVIILFGLILDYYSYELSISFMIA